MFESSLPILAVPTTYAGSEMTPIYGLTDAGLKRTGIDIRVMPKTVIYDPDLTLTLPVGMSITSGNNAIAHAAEGLYSRNASPLTSLMAEEGITALARSLPDIVANPDDPSARGDALYGSWLCGAVLGSVGMALHRKLCHTFGGSFNLPHAPSHTIVLPHALAYNAEAAPDAMKRISRAKGHESAAQGPFELARANGAPIASKDIGMREDQLDHAADLAYSIAYWNPCRWNVMRFVPSFSAHSKGVRQSREPQSSHTPADALDACDVLKTICSIARQHESTNAGSDGERLLVAEISGPKPDSVDVRLTKI